MRPLAPFLACLVGVACVGDVAGQATSPPPGAGPPPAAPVTSRPPSSANPPASDPAKPPPDMPAPPPPPAVEACQPGQTPGPLPSRITRLTLSQYENTLRTLFSAFPDAATARDPKAVPAHTAPFENLMGSERPRSVDFVLTVNATETESVLDAAESLAAGLRPRLERKHTCLAGWADRACVSAALGDAARVLYRRPLSAGELAETLALFDAARASMDGAAAAQVTLVALLSSPQFFFRRELGDAKGSLSPFEIADAIAYGLTDGPPDAALTEAASSGALRDKGEIGRQIERIASSGGLARGLIAFARGYFTYDAHELRIKPVLDHTVSQFGTRGRIGGVNGADLMTSTVLAESPVRVPQRLLTTRRYFAHASIDMLYGLYGKLPFGVPSDDVCPSRDGTVGVQKWNGACWYEMDGKAQGRAGMLNNPAFLAAFSTDKENELIRRGRFIRERLLCSPIAPAPASLADAVAEGLNRLESSPRAARDRVKAHADLPACSGCHRLMDPFAYPLEAFDIYGRPRTTETFEGHKFTIDPSADLALPERMVPIKRADELGPAIAASPAYTACFVAHYYDSIVAREDRCMAREAYDAYVQRGENLVELAKWIFTDDRFLTRARSK